MKNIDEGSIAQLMEDNMGIVVLLVNSFKPKNSNQLDEYMQLGRIGLWKALLNYDPARAKLSTAIWNYVRWEILRHLDKEKKNPTLLEINESTCEGKERIGSINNSEVWEIVPDNLDDKEVKVIQMRLEGHTFMDIGRKLGYSRGWANNVFKSALTKINEANGKEKNINVQ